MTALLILAVIPLIMFIYRYTRFSPWSKYLQGRLLLAQKIAWVALVVHLIAKRLWEYPGSTTVEYGIVLTLVVLFWWMFFALVEAQQEPTPAPRSTRGINADSNIEKTGPRPHYPFKGRKK